MLLHMWKKIFENILNVACYAKDLPVPDAPVVMNSCKGYGNCPSCNARRMVETAAHQVDHVFPRVPVRQWVLSLPNH